MYASLFLNNWLHFSKIFPVHISSHALGWQPKEAFEARCFDRPDWTPSVDDINIVTTPPHRLTCSAKLVRESKRAMLLA